MWRDLIPSARQLRHIGSSILDHLRLRFPRGEEARHYNVLQRLSYLVILFIVVPLLILTGLTMSPGLDAAFPFLTDALGGRQTARTIHFICAFTVVCFAIIHVRDGAVVGRLEQHAFDDYRMVRHQTGDTSSWPSAVDRRRALATLAASVSALPLAGCDIFSQNPTVQKVLDSAESLTMRAQRLLLSAASARAGIHRSGYFAAVSAPTDRQTQTMMPTRAWRNRGSRIGVCRWTVWLSDRCSCHLSELRALPARTQITRHDCVEGWSCIGKWTGVPLSIVLQRAGLKPECQIHRVPLR